MSESFGWTINLVNSVIGVSLLSMPFCFKKCGIILSIVLIVMSALLNRFSCYLLLKSAIIAKRRNYELLAFHTFGSTGKLLVELCILGFLLGTCIAFFVVIGDIGPSLVSQLFGTTNGPQLRAFVMTVLGMFVALPLGLLRRVDSLTSFSMMSLLLYVILAVKMLWEAYNTSPDNVWQQINYWDSTHVFSYLPIFSMALSCQTQLFAIFDSSLLHSNDFNTLNRLTTTVDRSINICSAIYITVGVFGYLAFCGQPFGGNVLIYLPSGFISTFTLIGFVASVLVSFPLCLFPCRTSLHSLMSRKGSTLLNPTSSSIHMSDRHFRLLTVALIVTTIGISILLPYIEFVLGILGSTIGAVICFIFPALIFLNLTTKNTTERLMAQLVVISGVFILIICTFSTLHDIYFVQNNDLIESSKDFPIKKLIPIEPQIKPKTEIFRTELKPTIKIHGLLNEPPRVPLPSMDASKAKRQEELLQRLERQQLEHKKLLEQQKELFNEMKQHNQLYHKQESKQLVIEPNSQQQNSPSDKTNANNHSVIKTVLIDNKQHSIDSMDSKPIVNRVDEKIVKKFEKPLVYLKTETTNGSIAVKDNKPIDTKENIVIKKFVSNESKPQNTEPIVPKQVVENQSQLKSVNKLSDKQINSSDNMTNVLNDSPKKEI